MFVVIWLVTQISWITQLEKTDTYPGPLPQTHSMTMPCWPTADHFFPFSKRDVIYDSSLTFISTDKKKTKTFLQQPFKSAGGECFRCICICRIPQVCNVWWKTYKEQSSRCAVWLHIWMTTSAKKRTIPIFTIILKQFYMWQRTPVLLFLWLKWCQQPRSHSWSRMVTVWTAVTWRTANYHFLTQVPDPWSLLHAHTHTFAHFSSAAITYRALSHLL